MRAAVRDKRLDAELRGGEPSDVLFERAEAAGFISADEHDLVRTQRLLAAAPDPRRALGAS